MKHLAVRSCLLAAAALVIAPGHAQATAPTLEVKGELLVGACTMNLSKATMDFGRINPANLTDPDINYVGSAEVGLAVACSAPTRFGLAFTDLVASPEEQAYEMQQLNLKAEGASQEFGYSYYTGFLADSLIDGVRAVPYLVRSGEQPEFNSGIHTAGPGSYMTLGRFNELEVAATKAATTLKLHGYVASSPEGGISEEVALSGSMGVELVYL